MHDSAFVSVTDFSMVFGKKTIIDNLSFTVAKGEIFGFLGANGSGKTTTLRALLGIYQATSGSLLVNGETYQQRLSHQTVLGYLPEERGLYRKESVIDVMRYFGGLKGLPANEAKTWSLDYLAKVGLRDKAKTRLDKLSGGQQQKIQLGITIMNNPDLLILDEPTKGLDPVNRKLLMSIVEEQHARGATTILVTHQMEEVERLCDRVMMLKDGKRAIYGKTDEVRRNFGPERIVIRYSGKLSKNPKLYTVKQQLPRFAELLPTDKTSPKAVIQALLDDDMLTLESFERRTPSLDDIFIATYGQQASEGSSI